MVDGENPVQLTKIEYMKRFLILLAISMTLSVSAQTLPLSGATETTPSKSEYFSWINHSFEGGTERQTVNNLDFFRWMRDTYGMQLDIYALDAGALDGGNNYGTTDSPKFREQFPSGFGPLSEQAAKFGTSLGLWAGPDGFGNTPEEAQKRIDMMVGFVRDYGFKLFKLDACCSTLSPDHWHYFDTMYSQIRHYAPDLVMLNHRIDLGPCTKYATTFLLGGVETYIDVHMANSSTATHHRVCALERRNPENLTRLTEDHGVCISSCLDYWDDDLILQAFNRNLILAPEIYGNPWLLRDDEFPYLAYIYNLHRDYRDILAAGVKRLPEDKYGYEAISRGDGSTQFLSLRNLSWEEKTYTITLGEEAGLKDSAKPVKVRMYHPYIFDMGKYQYGSTVEVKVLPFRAALVKITTSSEKDPVLISGIPYKIVNDRVGDKFQVQLLGVPGSSYKVTYEKGPVKKTERVSFDGSAPKHNYHRKLSDMQLCDVPRDIDAVYYATCFAADNNALEIRSLQRSGKSDVPEVEAARRTFFDQELFTTRSVWDHFMFDGNPKTDFAVSFQFGDRRTNGNSSLMLDMGECHEIDTLNFTTYDEFSLFPLKSRTGSKAYVSADLKKWKEIVFLSGVSTNIDLSDAGPVRYVRLENAPLRVTEINCYKDGKALDRSLWRASNLFRSLEQSSMRICQVWSSKFSLDEISEGAYLCVAINGEHGVEGAWAGFKIDGQYVGCPDRAPSFQSNPFECPVRSVGRGYTYFLPLTEVMVGKDIEAYVMSMGASRDLKPEVWITSAKLPYHVKIKQL